MLQHPQEPLSPQHLLLDFFLYGFHEAEEIVFPRPGNIVFFRFLVHHGSIVAKCDPS